MFFTILVVFRFAIARLVSVVALLVLDHCLLQLVKDFGKTWLVRIRPKSDNKKSLDWFFVYLPAVN